MSVEYYEDTPTKQRERLQKIKSRKFRKDPIEEEEQPVYPAMPASETRYDKPFVCYDDTPIIFGKLKGKKHSILKQPEWVNYCEWIIRQGSDFKYQSTRTYIIENVKIK